MIEFGVRLIFFSFKLILVSLYKYVIINLLFRIIHFLCVWIYQICVFVQENYFSHHDSSIKKIPNSIVLIFSPENSIKTKEIMCLVEYCKKLSIPKISVYDYEGKC